jgi:type I restriction enzyme S subunit
LKLYRKISDNPSVVWINEEVVTERIDANYYHVSHIQLNKSKIPMLKISTYCSLSKKRFNPNKYDKEYLKYIDISNVNINTGVFEHQLININEAPSRARKKVSKNDIIVSTVRPNRNAVSIINIEDEDLVASTGFAVIECKKNIDNYFLFAVLKTDNSVSQLVRKTSGGLYPAISEQDVMEIEIPIPSPEIQKYIGDKVRKAEELRDEAKKKRNEIEKNFLKMIGLKEEISFTEEKYRWALSNELETISAIPEYYKSKYLVVEKILLRDNLRVESIKKISKFIDEGSTPASKHPKKYYNKGQLFIRGGDIQRNSIEFDKVARITMEDYKRLPKGPFWGGDVLLTMRGNFGFSAVVPEHINEFKVNPTIAVIRPKDYVNSYYLATYLNSTLCRLQMDRLGQTSTRPQLNLSEVKTIKVVIPLKEIQEEIEYMVKDYISKEQKSKQLIQEAKQDVEDLIEGNFDMSKIKVNN